ncbi:MAG: hypothetical protein KBD19_04935, partial [Candidatus Moranbacteria bacterium]|nr:hypothetical protein [Candidatus Moranbacteria bacterium]
DETTLYTNKCAGPDDDWRDKVVKIKSEGTAGTTTRAVEVAVAAAGGGLTGGCILYGDSSTDNLTMERWGLGCNTAYNPAGSHSCGNANVTATGYSCGQVSLYTGSSSPAYRVFCNCVGN